MAANRHCCNRVCRLQAGSYDRCHILITLHKYQGMP
jgi:hypothetical protein